MGVTQHLLQLGQHSVLIDLVLNVQNIDIEFILGVLRNYVTHSAQLMLLPKMLLQVLKEPTKQKKVIFGGEDLLCCDTNMCDETGRVKGQVSENCIAKLVCESDCDVTNN